MRLTLFTVGLLMLLPGCRAVHGELADGTKFDTLVFGVDTHLQGLDATSPSGVHFHIDALDQKDVASVAALNVANNAIGVAARAIGAPVAPLPPPTAVAPIPAIVAEPPVLAPDPLERAAQRAGQP